MTIQHHLSDELLFDYATGRLGEAWSLLAATHLSLCEACRRRNAGFESLGGAALDDLAPAAMDEDALQACLARIAKSPSSPVAAAPPSTETVFPSPLRDYVGGDLSAVRWRSIGGGAETAGSSGLRSDAHAIVSTRRQSETRGVRSEGSQTEARWSGMASAPRSSLPVPRRVHRRRFN